MTISHKLGIAAALALIAAGACVSCGVKAEVKTEPPTFVSFTKFGLSQDGLYTVEHDKHWFIVWEGFKKGTLIHHPSCPLCKP